MERLLCQGVCVVLSSPTVAECGDTLSGPSLQVKGLEVEGTGPSLEPSPVWLQNPTSQPLPCSSAFHWEKKSQWLSPEHPDTEVCHWVPFQDWRPLLTVRSIAGTALGLQLSVEIASVQRASRPVCYYLYVESKKSSKLVNKILKKQTHRYREQASGY